MSSAGVSLDLKSARSARREWPDPCAVVPVRFDRFRMNKIIVKHIVCVCWLVGLVGLVGWFAVGLGTD